MHLTNISIFYKSILIDIREILLKRYFLLREIDRLVLLTKIDLSINIINIVIYLIEASNVNIDSSF